MSTINITGTGGIIEGNLDSANVNVNLDRALIFDGTDDYITCGTDTDYDFTNNFTLAGWAKNDNATVSSREHIIAKYAGQSGNRSFRLVANGDDMEFTVGYNSGDSHITVSHSGIDLSSWHHYAATFASGVMTLYVDGVQVVSTNNHGTTGDNIHSNNSRAINIGSYADGGGNFWQGNLADIRIYNAVLEQADIQLLASKINTDKSLGVGTTNLKGYWKLNNETASGGGTGTGFIVEESGNGQQGDLENFTGTYWDYDAYSVDVYDNSTQTTGTFTVTQGKVEGKALTSLDFDGSNDSVNCGDVEMNGLSGFTVSALFKDDDGGSQSRIVSKDQAGTAGAFILWINASGDLAFNVHDGSTFHSASYAAYSHTVGLQHAVGVFTGTAAQLYLDGVLVAETTFSSTTLDDSQNEEIFIGSDSDASSPQDFFNGKIRDVKIFNYALSAEQAASLYSNSYPQTADHQFKLDEGSGTTASDTGTGTASNGTISGATYSDGTLDLDGTLTIAANGTLSAPRGTLTFAGTIWSDSGAFTHNNGTVLIDGGSQGIQSSTFYNLTSDSSHAQTGVSSGSSITVENALTINSGKTFYISANSGASTITMGTTTSAGSFVNNGTSGAGTSHSYVATLQGASNLYPCVVTGNDLDWDRSGGTYNLKNLDYQIALATGGSNATTITLTGDCEFDALTVSNGDHLDLNGQRAVIDGVFDVDGTVDADGMFILNNAIDYDGSAFSNANNCTMIFRNTTGGIMTNDMVGVTNMKTLAFLNGSTSTDVIKGTNQYTMNGNVICGGRIDLDGTSQTNIIDLTIPTGGKLNPVSATVTCSGDFTTSGGLLGTSAIELNGVDEFAQTSLIGQWGGMHDALSIEFWFKTSFNGSSTLIDFDNAANNNNRIQVLQTPSEMAVKLYNSSGSSFQTGTTAFTINPDDGKWHHLAYTNSGSEQKIYYDGRLAGKSSHTIDRDNDPSMKLTVGKHRTLGSNYNGFMEELRFFTDVRTEAEIRADMFQGGTLANSGNLSARYSFDEGSGTAIDNSEGTTSRDLVASGTGVWPAGGTFNQSTSTLVMSGTDKNLTFHSGGLTLAHWTVSGTVDFNSLGSQASILMEDNLTVSGDLDSGSSSPFIRFGNDFVSNSGVLSLGGNVSGVYMFRFDHTSGTIDIPNTSTPRIKINGSGGTCRATSAVTATTELEVNDGTTFNANGNTIAAKEVDVNGSGTLDLRNSTLNFSVTTSGDTLSIEATGTLTTGNTTITGHTAQQTPAVLPDDGDFEVVGDISNLKIMSGGDLTVIGSVTNCLLQDSTANIRQFFHTLDTQQLLDADEAGDDDLRLEKPTLDNANELQTG